MADYEDNEEEEIEIEKSNDSDYADEHRESITCVVQILLCNQKASDTMQRYQIFLFTLFNQEESMQPHH